MKKISLLDDEQIVHKVKYSNKSSILTLSVFILFITIFNYLKQNQEFIVQIFGFLFMFILIIPTFFKLTFSLYRRFFQRIYLTNTRIIIANGYFIKFFKTFNIKDITNVQYRAKHFDRVNQASSIRITFNNNKICVFKKVKFGVTIANILSAHLDKK